MSRTVLIRTGVPVLTCLLFVSAALTQQPGDQVEGVVTRMERNELSVRSDDGRLVDVRVGSRTHVVVHPSPPAGRLPEARVDFLKPGMRVRLRYDTGVLDRVHVLEVPQGLWPSASPAAASPVADAQRRLTVRLLELDARRGRFRADVAGRSEGFQAKEPALLRTFEQGDLVVVTLADRGSNVVTGMRPALVMGRIVRVDDARREVVIDVAGRDEVFAIDDLALLRGLRQGDRIRFEYAEDGGRRAVTKIH
jgi:hypothetical protein